jgi:DNA (cytosine-5)-methyltransferase 1
MPTFIDLFAGAGGLSFGLKNAGWDPLLALDCWDDAVATHRLNQPDHPAWCSNIEEVTAEEVLGAVGAPDWIVGGPPCQGFSTVGKRDRNDPRNRLVRHFHRLVSEIRPQGFLIENVSGLRVMDFEGEIRTLFESLGYSVTSRILTSAEHGVPQLRRRIVFVGHLDQGYFLGPEATHSADQFVTVWDAIGDLPTIEAGEAADEYDNEPFTEYQRALRNPAGTLTGHVASKHPPHLVEAISHIPDGGNRRSIPDQLQPRSGFHNSYSRLDSKAPAVAVTQNMGKPSGTRCIHPFSNRGLTAREGARLQGFPDWFTFTAGSTSQRLQVANAVPPVLAKAIGRAILDSSRWTEKPETTEEQLALDLPDQIAA